MTSYQPDIMQAAERALDQLLCNCTESLGSTQAVRDASIKDIAAAIADEREKCAVAASTLDAADMRFPGLHETYADGRRAAAAKIRRRS